MGLHLHPGGSPGENVPGHDSLASKLACGPGLLREETGICRDILVDDLAGPVHRAYGLMPNMTWVIDRGGRVAYKAPGGPTPDWLSFTTPVPGVSQPPAVRIQAAGRVAPDGQDGRALSRRVRLIECQLADTCLPGRRGRALKLAAHEGGP